MLPAIDHQLVKMFVPCVKLVPSSQQYTCVAIRKSYLARLIVLKLVEFEVFGLCKINSSESMNVIS